MTDASRMHQHLRDHFRHVGREGGPRQILDDLTSASVRLLDPHASKFMLERSDAPPLIMKVLDARAEGSQAQSEAFLWTFFDSAGFDRGYRGAGIPPDGGRAGARFDSRSNITLLNFARLLDVTLFSGEDAIELRRDLLCADRGDIVSPRRQDPLTRRVEGLLEEGIMTQPVPEEWEEEGELAESVARDPLEIALDDVRDAMRAKKPVDLFVVRIAASEGDARLLLHEGPRPTENTMNLLVQLLGTLRSLYDSDGFVHGHVELREVAYETVSGSGSAELSYETPDETRVVVRADRDFRLFVFQSLKDGRLSERRQFEVRSFREGTPGMRWAREWEARDDPIARSSDLDLHALDLHALGLNVLESVAWRIGNVKDSAKIKDELWDIARFCHQRLILRTRDVEAGDHVPREKAYSVDMRRVLSLYRLALRDLLKRERTDVGNRALSRVVFSTYSRLGFRRSGEEKWTPLADLTSDPSKSGDKELLVDVLALPGEAGIHVRKPARLDWWTHPLFDSRHEPIESGGKKRRIEKE